MTRCARRERLARGFSLVELMVSLAIGLVVVGALTSAWLATAQSGRHTQAMVQLAEDANAALGLIRNQVAMAGYSEVLGVDALGLQRHAFPAVFGCEAAAFADLQMPITGAPACATPATGGPDVLEVAFQAGVVAGPAGALRSNSLLGAGGVPLDCLGNAIPAQAGGPAPWYLGDSKFYLQSGRLYCHGPGAAPGAPVVDNVEDFQVRYGLSDVPGSGHVAWYAVAPPAGSAQWDDVVAVGVCVLVRSADRVIETGSTGAGNYTDCAGTARSATDGYLRRAFSTTVALQNRMP